MSPTPDDLANDKRLADLKAKKQKAHEKSFDSLQRIHAVIFALAIGEAVKRILTINDSTHHVEPLFEYLPQFFTLILTIIPFYHGTHRHFDDCYVFNEKPLARKRFLFFDLLACLLTACIFFWLALAIKEDAFFYILTFMLAFNCFWAVTVCFVHGAGTWKWSTINVFAVAIYLSILFPFSVPVPWVLRSAVNLLPLVIIFGWDLFRALYRKDQSRKASSRAPFHFRMVFILSLCTAVLIILVWLFYWNSDPLWHGVFRQGAFLVVAVLRTFFDYYWRWHFYFPEIDGAGTERGITDPPPAAIENKTG